MPPDTACLGMAKKDTLRVRNHSRSSVHWNGTTYTWPKDGVLVLPAPEARALAAAHLGLTLEAAPALTHEVPDGNAESTTQGAGD